MELPATAVAPRLEVVAPGTRLHRLHHRDYAGARLNPCRGEPIRFAPIVDAAGACIPSLYAATSFDAAAFETVFRGPGGRFRTVPRQALDDRAATVLRPRRALSLVPLFTPELQGWGLDAPALFAPEARIYALCRRLAERLWRDNPAADGLIWASVRDSSARALVLFGDRVAETDFDVLSARQTRDDETLLADLAAAGRRASWVVAR